MSVCICEGCDAPIDSDYDADCFVEIGNMRRMTATKILCEWCRDQMFENDERQASMENEGGRV